MNLDFEKVNVLPETVKKGTVYFESGTYPRLVLGLDGNKGLVFSGLLDASFEEGVLVLMKSDKTEVEINIAGLAEEALAGILETKLDIGTEGDASTVKSYHGIMKRIDGLNPESIVHFAPSVGKPEVPESTLDNILLKTAQALTPEEQGQVKKNLGLDAVAYYEDLGEVEDINLNTEEE